MLQQRIDAGTSIEMGRAQLLRAVLAIGEMEKANVTMRGETEALRLALAAAVAEGDARESAAVARCAECRAQLRGVRGRFVLTIGSAALIAYAAFRVGQSIPR